LKQINYVIIDFMINTVFIVPMRNETQYKMTIVFNDKKEFLSYLWGIETIQCLYHLSVYGQVFIVPMRNWNKNIHTIKATIHHCFYRTYEELKREDERKCIPSPSPVFIVPMRNWNFLVNISFALFSLKFLSYLWGIETTLFNLLT